MTRRSIFGCLTWNFSEKTSFPQADELLFPEIRHLKPLMSEKLGCRCGWLEQSIFGRGSNCGIHFLHQTVEQTWNSDRNVLALRTHYKPICSLRFLLEVWFGHSDWVNDALLFSGHENSNLKISGDWWWNSTTVYKGQQYYPRDVTILNGQIYQEVPSGHGDWFRGGSQVGDEEQKIVSK